MNNFNIERKEKTEMKYPFQINNTNFLNKIKEEEICEISSKINQSKRNSSFKHNANNRELIIQNKAKSIY